MNECNFSLLTQEEIDTLVEFLSKQKSSVSSEVLSQKSIDKIIFLIKNNEINRIRLDTEELGCISNQSLAEVNLISNNTPIGELHYKINPETNFIELYAVNSITKEKCLLTPAVFFKRSFKDTESSWGFSIAPVTFNEIATIFKLKYTAEDYDSICKLFALKNFGNETYKLNEVFLASENSLLKNLI